MSPILQTILISLFTGGTLLVLGFLLGRVGERRNRKSAETLRKEVLAIEEVKVRDNRIGDLERAVESLEAKSDAQTKAAIPIEAAMQAMLIAKLTNAHTPEADALLKKQTDGTLTAEEAAKLLKAMKLRETDMEVSESQRLSAKMLPDVIRLKELREMEERSSRNCKTVMVTVPETETITAQDGGTQEQEKGN